MGISGNSTRGAVVGCGRFARHHLHGWREQEGVEIVAVCDADPARAREFAKEFGVKETYGDFDELLDSCAPDFVDVVTGPEARRGLVERAAGRGVPVICQKPMAPSLEDARAMVEACREAGVPFMVHENFRWQPALRATKASAAHLGDLFYGRVHLRSAYDVTADQPYLAGYPRFILYDLGVHLLDVARFLLGEAERVYCRTRRVNGRLKGEDVATVLLDMAGGATCVVEMSYASKRAEDCFPQALVDLEGTRGSVTLGPHFEFTEVGERTVSRRTLSPRRHSWLAPHLEATQESVVAIQRHWLECLRLGRDPETSGSDHLRTLELVFAAYASAETGLPVPVGRPAAVSVRHAGATSPGRGGGLT